MPTETGELVVDSLAGKFKFMDLEFTRDVEEDLYRIAQGEAEYKAVISCVHDQLKQEFPRFTFRLCRNTPTSNAGRRCIAFKGKAVISGDVQDLREAKAS